MSFNQTLNEKVVPVIMKFVNMKGIIALKDGMLYTLPLNIVGSLFLLIAAFPLESFTNFMANTFGPNWNDPLYKCQGATMNIMALVGLIGMAYVYARNEGVEPMSASTIALSTYLILNNSLPEMIYKFVQTPLQGASDSLGGAMLIAFFVPFLWFFGIHGGVTVGGMVGTLLTANTMDNAALQAAGTLDLAHGAHIVTQQFLDNFINLSGSGQTIGIVIFMCFLAKSAQFKQLGKLSAPSALFNINEPILFGTPIVMNPIIGVPFIAVPVVNAILLYLAISTGILPPMGGQLPPWTTPPILSGFILGGFKYALAQAVLLAVGFVIYFPFIKKIDTMNYQQELDAVNGVQA